MRLRSWLAQWHSALRDPIRNTFRPRPQRKPARTRLQLELLEDRAVPAVINFTNGTDVTVDDSSDTVSLNIDSSIFGATATINSVRVTVNFDKIDNITTTGPFNNEIVYRLTSPAGTTVNLINAGTYSSTSPDVIGAVSVTFDADAANLVGPNVVAGTFRPVGNLNNFISQSPAGTWTLFIQDTANLDSLEHKFVTLTINAVPATAPELDAKFPTVTIDEGQTATNDGKFSDVNTWNNVTFTSSIGTVTKSGGSTGTWSWSLGNTDGPVDTNVTITATDNTGLSSTTTFRLIINEVPPTITVTGPDRITEGFPYQLNFGTINDTPNDVVSAIIVEWGDGASDTYVPTESFAIHTYADGQLDRRITVKLTNEDGTFIGAEKIITVDNFVPSITLTGKDTILVGTPYELTLGAVLDTGDDTVTAYTVFWGDGTSQFFDVPPTGQVHTHVYTIGDINRTITVSLVDDDGIHAAAGSKTIRVRTPTTIIVNGAASVDEGAPYQLTFGALSSPIPPVTQIIVDWGDGSAPETFAPGQPFATHIYADGQLVRNIVVSLVDEDGTHVGARKTITVNNVPPTIELTGADLVTAATPYALTLGAITDPGTDTVSEYRVNWGDGSPAEFFVGNPTGKAHNHTFPAGNFIHTITVDLVDEDGTHVAAGAKVVRFLTLAGPASVDEGAVYTLNLDRSTFDPIATWIITWGDGTAPQSFTGNPANATHIYKDEGSYTISARANDEEGTFDAANTLTVTVNNVPTFLSATKTDALVGDNDGDGEVDPGDTIRYTITITNDGPDDADDVSLQDTPDPNTTLDPNSIRVTPVALDDNFVVRGPFVLVVGSVGLLANDFDPDLTPGGLAVNTGSVSLVSGPNLGALTVFPDGSFRLFPITTGTATFRYTIRDGSGLFSVDPGFFTITVTSLLPLTADLPPVVAPQLSDAELAQLSAAARQRWVQFGLTPEQRFALESVQIVRADLPANTAALNTPGFIQIDSDAGGHGWFVDATPQDNIEFAAQSATLFVAGTGSAPEGHLDLLSAIMRQMGQVMGISAGSAPDLMQQQLAPGERRLPPPRTLDAALGSLREQHGFHFAGNYWQNYANLQEKWFQNRTGAWHVITPAGKIYLWKGSEAASPLVATVSSAVHADPNLLFNAPVNFTDAALTQLAQLRRAHGFHFAGSYYLNYTGLNEKWLQDRAGAWHLLTPDGKLYRGSVSPVNQVAALSPTLYDNPDLLFQAPVQWSVNEQVQLDQLRTQHGFHFGGNWWLNYAGMGEKWFQDDQGQWFTLTPDGKLWRGSPRAGVQVDALSPVIHDDPQLLFQGPVSLSANELNQFAALRQTPGFRFTGNYSLNWAGLNEKWIQSQSGAWHILTPDGGLYLWGGSLAGSPRLALLNPVVYQDPSFLFAPAPVLTTTASVAAPDDSALSAAALESIADAARQRWENSGLTAQQQAALEALTFEVADLPGLTLGLASAGKIQIDSDAAGRAWFVDDSPLDDSEFATTVAPTHRTAGAGSDAAGKFDLLTTVLHEMGHVLGLPDYYTGSDDLMYAYLQQSERRLPADGQADGATPGSAGASALTASPFVIGTLPPGRSVAVLFDVDVNSPITPGLREVANQGTVRGTDSGTGIPYVASLTDDPAEPGATDPTRTPLDDIVDLKITATFAPFQVAPGGTIVYTLTYTNLGNATATGVLLTIQLPAGTTFNASASTSGWTHLGGGVFRLQVASVAAATTGNVTFAATLPLATTIPNSIATIASITDDGASGLDFNPLDNTTGLVQTVVEATNGRRWR